jgi:hypothetical protein
MPHTIKHSKTWPCVASALALACSGGPTDTDSDTYSAPSFYEGCTKTDVQEYLLIPPDTRGGLVYETAETSTSLIYVDGVWVGHVEVYFDRIQGRSPALLARLHGSADGLELIWMSETPDIFEEFFPQRVLTRDRYHQRQGMDIAWTGVGDHEVGVTTSSLNGWAYESYPHDSPTSEYPRTSTSGGLPGTPWDTFWFKENQIVLREVFPGPFEMSEDDVVTFPEMVRHGFVGDPEYVYVQRSLDGGRFVLEFAGDTFDENDRALSGGTTITAYDATGVEVWTRSFETSAWRLGGRPLLLELDAARIAVAWFSGQRTRSGGGEVDLALLDRLTGTPLDETVLIGLHEFDEIDSRDHGRLELATYGESAWLRPLSHGREPGAVELGVERAFDPNELWRVKAPNDKLMVERTLTSSLRHEDGTHEAVNELDVSSEPDVPPTEPVRIDASGSLDAGRLGQAASADTSRYASMWLEPWAQYSNETTHTELVVYFQELDCE